MINCPLLAGVVVLLIARDPCIKKQLYIYIDGHFLMIPLLDNDFLLIFVLINAIDDMHAIVGH